MTLIPHNSLLRSKEKCRRAERANKTCRIPATPAVSAIDGLTKLSNLSTCKLGLHERFLSFFLFLFFFFFGKTITKLQEIKTEQRRYLCNQHNQETKQFNVEKSSFICIIIASLSHLRGRLIKIVIKCARAA